MQRHYFANKSPSSQSYDFSSSHVWMWELEHKEVWVLKYWCFWTMVLEKTLESPLDFKEIKPVNLKGNQPWIIIGRIDAEVETPVFWPLIQIVDLLVKSLMLGKIEGRRRGGRQRMKRLNGLTDAMDMNLGKLREMVRGHRGLPCCSPWGHRQLDMTEWLNNKLLPSCLHGTSQWWIWKQSLQHMKVQESLRIFFKNPETLSNNCRERSVTSLVP